MAKASGISVCLVTNPSKNPAKIKKGMVLKSILSPFFTPLLNDSSLLNVVGNKIPLARTNPAAPDIIITEISIVPCIHMVLADSQSKPLS